MIISKQNFQAPEDRVANLRFRAEIIQRADEDVEFQEVLKLKCKQDIKFFFNTFAWTFDPRLSDPVVPFILYPKQFEFIMWLDALLAKSRTGEKVNGLVDKPRAVGATFCVMVWALYHYLFDDFSARVGSRKEDYVDKKGEQDTLFYKLDFNLERLPHWMLPKDFDQNNRPNMLLTHPQNTNGISGESANSNFGRGGRKSVTIFDEHAFWEWAKSSWESAGESTNFRLTMSTPPESGKDSHFYKLNVGKMGKVERFEFDWSDVPTRDAKWFAQQKETKSDEEMAREVLKSYDGTTEGKVYAVDFKFATLNEDGIPYRGNLENFLWWDFGLDTVAMLWVQKDLTANKLYLLESYSNSNKSIDFYYPFVTGIVKSGIHDYTEEELEMIERHKKWGKLWTHFGDPDVKKRAVKDGESTYDVLKKAGIVMGFTDWGGREWKDLKENTKLSFRRLEVDSNRNTLFISAMKNARYPKKRENSQSTTEPAKPVHDWTSHFRSAYEYGVDNEVFIDTEPKDKTYVSHPDDDD